VVPCTIVSMGSCTRRSGGGGVAGSLGLELLLAGSSGGSVAGGWFGMTQVTAFWC
jgi:hypothetical protein